MRINLIVLMVLFGVLSCKPVKEDKVEDMREPIADPAEENPTGLFGAKIESTDYILAGKLELALGEQDSLEITVKGEINEVCTMKGCWMTMATFNGESVRITFKDYGFFVPKNSSGYTATVEGVLFKSIVDVETLKHYAEDAGKSQDEIDAITEPSEQLSLIASGVAIEESISS